MQKSSYILHFAICIFCLLLTGCRPSDSTTVSHSSGAGNAAISSQYHNDLLTYAIDNLNRLEEFGSPDVLQEMIQRINSPQQKESPLDPLLAAWPEPEMQRQVVDRLNQWIRTQKPPADWRLDPMIATLSKPLANLSQVKNLDRMEFSRFDGYALQEAVWLRDVSRWARGDALDDVERAKSLFDWTVRNIQLDADSAKRIPQFPWETLLFGRGTATERAWVFLLLARQVGIDAAMLGIEEKAERGKRKAENSPLSTLHSPLLAVLIEGNAYLFDPTLGLPIPALNGVTRDAAGQLAIQPATLAQAAADEKLLRQLDANENHVYGVKASDLKHVVVMLEASPTYLAQRMKLLESRLAGDQKMVLTTSPTSQAKPWKAIAQVADVRLWLPPFETLERRAHLDRAGLQSLTAIMLPFYAMPSSPLQRGRALYLKGNFIGDDGATKYYQMARPSNQELAASSAHPIEKLLYLNAKQDASYWLGLIAYQRANYPAAIDYFTKRTLLFTADNPWADGARYNLARTFEITGEAERAMLQYDSNDSSPGYLGDLLRAKWLRQTLKKQR